MARSVKEWIGRSDDAAIPPRVKDRIARRQDDCCERCKRKVGGKLRAEFDHAIPLILGGRHAESNLSLLCHECHAKKTKLDVKLKAKVARVRKRELGVKKPKGRPMPGTRASGWKHKIGGGWERRLQQVCGSTSDTPHQHKNDQNNQNKADASARPVAPAAAVSPRRQRADEGEDQHDYENGRKHVQRLAMDPNASQRAASRESSICEDSHA